MGPGIEVGGTDDHTIFLETAVARYRLRQKILALGSDFTIQDDGGVDVYKVDGKVLSIGDKLSFEDVRGHELLHIRQKVLRFRPTHEIQRRGTTVATVRKELLTH